ncbi:MAG TPA: trypsin-like peptidase domain-containing protein, partial [Armatimonadota bacterium]|nr:trypsin-like peptidase domain-containing protein [Armatimonadota bacterium]
MQLKQVADVLRREIRSPARALLAVVPLVLGTLAAAGPARAQGVTAEDAVVLIRTTSMLRSARGSGFIIGDGSWVVTASHVVSADLGKGRRANDTTALVYSPWTGRPYEAKVVAVDGVADIALLRMPQPGFPALAVEGLGVTEATAALAALKDRPLRLYGFPLSYGEATVAALAKPEHNDSKLREIAKRGETSLCVMGACPDVQPGWSGGPMVSTDRGTVVGVFHSLYRPKEDPKQGYPAGSVAGYLGDLLQRAGVTDLKPFGQPAPPTLPRAPNAAERMAHEMRSLSWSAGGDWKRAEEEQRAILKLAPEDALARVELGKLLSVQKKHEEAVKELQEAVRLAPKSLMANLYLGRALHLSYDTKAAIAALRAAAEVSPNEAEPHLTLAEVHEADQKPDEAEAVLRAAMQNVPTHPGIVFRLGNLLMRM